MFAPTKAKVVSVLGHVSPFVTATPTRWSGVLSQTLARPLFAPVSSHIQGVSLVRKNRLNIADSCSFIAE